MWHLAIMKTTIANATFFATMAPLWVVIFGWVLFRHRAEKTTLIGLALCLFGGGALVYQSLSINPAHMLGDALGIGTGVFFGLYFLAVGAARKGSGAARVTFEMSIVTIVVLLAAALIMRATFFPRPASAGACCSRSPSSAMPAARDCYRWRWASADGVFVAGDPARSRGGGGLRLAVAGRAGLAAAGGGRRDHPRRHLGGAPAGIKSYPSAPLRRPASRSRRPRPPGNGPEVRSDGRFRAQAPCPPRASARPWRRSAACPGPCD